MLEPIHSAADVERCLRARLLALDHEELHVLGLDRNLRLLLHHVAAVGGARQLWAQPAAVFRPLVRGGAAAAIVVHNHPSGRAAPSDADGALTERLALAGDALGIVLIDHVIIARGGRYSFCESGRLRV